MDGEYKDGMFEKTSRLRLAQLMQWLGAKRQIPLH